MLITEFLQLVLHHLARRHNFVIKSLVVFIQSKPLQLHFDRLSYRTFTFSIELLLLILDSLLGINKLISQFVQAVLVTFNSRNSRSEFRQRGIVFLCKSFQKRYAF